jgi:DNA replication protein DnaC
LRTSWVLFRTAAALATELEVAQQQLRLPKLLAQYRRYALILVDEVGYLPFSQTAALLDRLVHRSHILLLEGESFRFRQSLEQHQEPQQEPPTDAPAHTNS